MVYVLIRSGHTMSYPSFRSCKRKKKIDGVEYRVLIRVDTFFNPVCKGGLGMPDVWFLSGLAICPAYTSKLCLPHHTHLSYLREWLRESSTRPGSFLDASLKLG
jgi:hypothetical protein